MSRRLNQKKMNAPTNLHTDLQIFTLFPARLLSFMLDLSRQTQEFLVYIIMLCPPESLLFRVQLKLHFWS